jgi:hypothetical protein
MQCLCLCSFHAYALLVFMLACVCVFQAWCVPVYSFLFLGYVAWGGGGRKGGGESQVCFGFVLFWFFKDGLSIVSGDSLFHFIPSILFFGLYSFSSLDSVGDSGFKEG